MTALTPMMFSGEDEFKYRDTTLLVLTPDMNVFSKGHERDPEFTSPYGDNNHPLPPFVPNDVRTVKGVGQ